MKEHIDGEILADCNEAMLDDLGVSSAIHKSRLMKIISGKHSAQYFTLTGGKLYASLNHSYRIKDSDK